MHEAIVRSFVVPVCLSLGLLGGFTSAMAEQSGDVAAKSGYVVKPGDTLDKVVRQAYPNSPLRPELLREEIVRLNPAAMTKGSPKVLMAGATLQLPPHEALASKHLGKPAIEVSGAATSSEARRHWVRYP
jgi:Tfp pilus assembly protein FimV